MTRDAVATTDIVVVGAGAAGLTAAIFAAETARMAARSASGAYAPSIVLLESARKIGAKILVSGGGRCNVTHEAVVPEDFNGPRHVVRNVLAAFDVPTTVRWFASLGVALKREETGKLFPVTDRAQTVLAALLTRCRLLDVTVLTGRRVADVIREADASLAVHHEGGILLARRVVMATGGRSLPRTGSDGSGWAMVERLGHTVTETHPALVPLVLAGPFFHAELSGISHPVELSTFADRRLVDRRSGSLLWTHFGMSGPVVMDASRHWVIARARGACVEMRCSFVPGESFAEVERRLVTAAGARPRLSLARFLGEWMADRLATALACAAGVQPDLPLGQLARAQRRTLAHVLTALVLPVQCARGWDYAEVTAGGVPLGEIDFRTMASRRVPGLYLVGEMLDCDGRIGGFNFQWAWTTGHLAGRAAVMSLGRPTRRPSE